jgi:hypothetical protein
MSDIAQLTTQQRTFAKRYFEIGNAAQAYRDTHPDFTGPDDDAANQGYLFKQRIIAKIGFGDFLEFAGLTDAMLSGKLKELVGSQDERVGLGATKLGMQLRGRLVERSEVELSGKRSFSDVLKDDADRAAKETKEESQEDKDA